MTGSGRITGMNWRRDHLLDWGDLTFRTFIQWQGLGQWRRWHFDPFGPQCMGGFNRWMQHTRF